MTILLLAAKALLLIAFAVVSFAALAMMLGFEPAMATDIAACKAEPSPICLFTII